MTYEEIIENLRVCAWGGERDGCKWRADNGNG